MDERQWFTHVSIISGEQKIWDGLNIGNDIRIYKGNIWHMMNLVKSIEKAGLKFSDLFLQFLIGFKHPFLLNVAVNQIHFEQSESQWKSEL